MNKIDRDFTSLMKKIELLTEEELRTRIKRKFLSIPIETQQSIENFFEKFSYWGSLKRENNDFQEIENRARVLKNNVNHFKMMYEELEDYRSKKILFAILSNWFDYDFVNLASVMEHAFSHYCDLDILPTCQDEIFVDLGAYTGDTIIDFVKIYGSDSFQKIYAYEMSPESVLQLKENTSALENVFVRNVAVSDSIGVGSCSINFESASANVLENNGTGNISITTLDEDITEKITMLKMDIEGSETKALLGSFRHIKEDGLKLMVSVYHGFDDLIGIWYKIKEMNPYYKYYLRYYGGPIFPTEIVLYAIPKKN